VDGSLYDPKEENWLKGYPKPVKDGDKLRWDGIYLFIVDNLDAVRIIRTFKVTILVGVNGKT
jgi:hypothetical protein